MTLLPLDGNWGIKDIWFEVGGGQWNSTIYFDCFCHMLCFFITVGCLLVKIFLCVCFCDIYLLSSHENRAFLKNYKVDG